MKTDENTMLTTLSDTFKMLVARRTSPVLETKAGGAKALADLLDSGVCTALLEEYRSGIETYVEDILKMLQSPDVAATHGLDLSSTAGRLLRHLKPS